MSEDDVVTIQVVELVRSSPVVDDMLILLAGLSFCALLGAKATLFTKILWFRDCSGVSGKTQIIYTIVFAARYLDLASSYYVNPINVSLAKISLLLMTYGIVLSIYFFYYESYQGKHDNFRLELLILPSLVLGLLANYGPDISQVFWAFSVYLEAMAIIPQICFCSKAKKVENSVYNYVLLLTLYKSFHVMGEMYNHFYASSQFDRISLAAGVVQLMLYCDFFTREESENTPEETVKDLESGNEQPSVFVHPKEVEAMRSAGYTRFDDNLSEVVLTPSMLTVTTDDDKANSTAAAAAAATVDAAAGAVQEEKKTTVHESPVA